jgi:basic membrane lipoprotein Med (substrate-binding protein (PBP1-ABC) superfamily)
MKNRLLCLVIAVLGIVAVPMFAAPINVGIFVPGVTAGSPLYEQLVSGAMQAASENANVNVKVVEGGFNQADWPEKVMSMAATGEYTYILTSNPSLPAICAEAAKSFPKQKFICMDGNLAGNPSIFTLMYNQVEQGYMAGYLAGLVTKSKMKGATPELKVGAIVAQEYPALTLEMIPGYTQGFQAVDKNITLDYRVIGNWWDANKGADLANSMMDAGVDVILSIAGGAGQGTIKAAQARGRYVIYFDANVYKLAPGTIIGCATLDQERAVYETLTKAVKGSLKWGTAEVVDTKAGYVGFADTDPLYTANVAADVRSGMAALMAKFRSGALKLPIPKM